MSNSTQLSTQLGVSLLRSVARLTDYASVRYFFQINESLI